MKDTLGRALCPITHIGHPSISDLNGWVSNVLTLFGCTGVFMSDQSGNPKVTVVDLEARSDYLFAVQRLAAAFQYLEAALRGCIALAYELIRFRVSDFLQFKLDEASLDKDSLGTLTRRFNDLIADSTLVEELRRLTPERNEVAHRALMIGPGKQPSEKEYLLAQQTRIKELTDRVYACQRNVQAHVGRLQQKAIDLLGRPSS